MQMLVMPSREDFEAWEICHHKRTGESTMRFGRKRVWYRSEDLKKFATPIVRLKYPRIIGPTVKERHVKLTEADIESISPPERLEHWPVTAAFVSDPDGYQVEILQHHGETPAGLSGPLADKPADE